MSRALASVYSSVAPGAVLMLMLKRSLSLFGTNSAPITGTCSRKLPTSSPSAAASVALRCSRTSRDGGAAADRRRETRSSNQSSMPRRALPRALSAIIAENSGQTDDSIGSRVKPLRTATNGHRHGDGQVELLEELADDAAHSPDRQEHGDHGQRWPAPPGRFPRCSRRAARSDPCPYWRGGRCSRARRMASSISRPIDSDSAISVATR